MFQENVKIRYSEMDFDTVLKPASLLQFLQDLASDNAEALGFGYSYTVKNNLAWFLLKYHIEFTNYPKGIYELNIKTEPRGYNKLFAFRDFEIVNVARACTTWALVDLSTKSMVNVADSLLANPYMKQYEKRDDDLVYSKIKVPDKVDREHVFEIRFDDLDVNRHVNNSNYIVWAFELLDFEFRKSKKLKTLDMLFKKEITYGSKVLSQLKIEGDKTYHVLKNNETGEDLCHVLAQWENKN